VLQRVGEFHAAEPLGDGVPIAGLPAALRLDPVVVDLVIERLVSAGAAERRGAVLTRPGWTPTVSDRDASWRERLLAELARTGAEPPDVASLTAAHHRDPVPILRILEREGRVVGVEPGRFYAAEAVAGLLGKLRDGMTEGREYSPAELREVLGLSRKYLIPFLEYCDRKRYTERRTTGRVRLPSMA
jgi:selenocysteine-specific elongation factor